MSTYASVLARSPEFSIDHSLPPSWDSLSSGLQETTLPFMGRYCFLPVSSGPFSCPHASSMDSPSHSGGFHYQLDDDDDDDDKEEK